MRKVEMAILMAISTLLCAAPAVAQNAGNDGQAQAVVTVLSKKKGGEMPVNITQQDIHAKVNNKQATVTGWVPLRGTNGRLELVVLIDGSARTSLGQQLGDIADFFKSLPPDVKVALGYMEYGRTVLTGPLSTDHGAAVQGLHLPSGMAGSSGSPYFCISDLAKRWPSNDRGARREVVLITDGVDNYEQHFDPDDPYVETATNDSIRAGLVLYAIYWKDRGFMDQTGYGSDTGQNLLAIVTGATGGASYWNGLGDPVSFQPYFEDLSLRLQNQYLLSVSSPLNGKDEIANMSLKVGGPAAKVYAPKQVYLTHPGGQ